MTLADGLFPLRAAGCAATVDRHSAFRSAARCGGAAIAPINEHPPHQRVIYADSFPGRHRDLRQLRTHLGDRRVHRRRAGLLLPENEPYRRQARRITLEDGPHRALDGRAAAAREARRAPLCSATTSAPTAIRHAVVVQLHPHRPVGVADRHRVGDLVHAQVPEPCRRPAGRRGRSRAGERVSSARFLDRAPAVRGGASAAPPPAP